MRAFLRELGVPRTGWFAIGLVLAGGVAAQTGLGLIVAYAFAASGVFLTLNWLRENR